MLRPNTRDDSRQVGDVDGHGKLVQVVTKLFNGSGGRTLALVPEMGMEQMKVGPTSVTCHTSKNGQVGKRQYISDNHLDVCMKAL